MSRIGEVVEAGQVLAELDDTSASAGLAEGTASAE